MPSWEAKKMSDEIFYNKFSHLDSCEFLLCDLFFCVFCNVCGGNGGGLLGELTPWKNHLVGSWWVTLRDWAFGKKHWLFILSEILPVQMSSLKVGIEGALFIPTYLYYPNLCYLNLFCYFAKFSFGISHVAKKCAWVYQNKVMSSLYITWL